MADYINKVGLGVEVEDGEESLKMLRAIRTEAVALVETFQRLPKGLSRGSSGTTTQAAQGYNNPDQGRLFSDGIKRQQTLFSQAELENTRITNRETDKRVGYRLSKTKQAVSEEVQIELAAQKKIDDAKFKSRVSQRVEEIKAAPQRAAQEKAAQEKFRKESLEANLKADEQVLSEYRNRKRQLVERQSNNQDVLSTNNDAQRKLFKRYRTSERDDLTQQWRDELAVDLRGQRLARDKRKQARDREFENIRKDIQEDLSQKDRIRQDETKKFSARKPSTVDEDAEMEELRRSAGFGRSRSLGQQSPEQKLKVEEAKRLLAFRDFDFGANVKTTDAARDKFIKQQNELTKLGKSGGEVGPIQENIIKTQELARNLKTELESPATMKRTRAEVEADLDAINKSVKQTDESIRRLKENIAQKGPTTVAAKDPLAFSDDVKSVNNSRDRFIKQQSELGRLARNPRTRTEAEEIQKGLQKTQETAQKLTAELTGPLKGNRLRSDVVADLQYIQREANRTDASIRRLKETAGGGGNGPNLPGGRGPGGRGGANGPVNERGFFTTGDVLGRITRNILLYELVSKATYGLAEYISTSIEAAKQADKTATDLENAARRSQQSVAGLVQFAEQIRNTAGLSRESAQRTLTEASYFSENQAYKTTDLAKAVTNIAAARGIGGSDVPDLVEQFRRGESKFYKRQLGKTVDELYQEEAQKVVARNGDNYVQGSRSFAGDTTVSNLTNKQRIQKVISEFSQEQKEIILVNAIIEEGNKVTGAAEKYQRSLAGQLDRTSERWKDLSASIGRFVLALKPLQTGLEYITGKLEKLSGADVLGTGPGGSITGRDIQQYGENSTSSLAYAVEQYGGTALTAGLAGVGSLKYGKNLLARIPGTNQNAIRAAQRAGASEELIGTFSTTAGAGTAGGVALGLTAAAGIGALVVALGGLAAGVKGLVTGEGSLKAAGDYFGYVERQIKLLLGGGAQELTEATAKQKAYEAQLAQQEEDRKSGRIRLQRYKSNYLNANGERVTELDQEGARYTQEQFDRLARENPTLYNRADYGLTRATDQEFALTEAPKADRELYRKQAADREELRKQEEIREDERRKQERINQQASALQRLREARTGSFRLVGEIAEGQTPENQYTKILADQATTAQRMVEQWGYLGKGAVDYFTAIENKKNVFLEMKQDFEAFSKAQQLTNRAFTERNQRRLSPELSTRESLGLGVLNSSIQSTREIIESYKNEAQLGGYLGFNDDFYKDKTRVGKEELSKIFQAGLAYGANAAPSRQTSEATVAAQLDVLSQFTPNEIKNDPYLLNTARSAYRQQRFNAYERTQDEVKKFQLNELDQQQLGRNLDDAENLRQRLIREGKDPRFVGRAYDQYLLSRTDNVPIKDLTYVQFEQRQAAQRRQAEATVAEKEEARAAVKQGLAYQKVMLEELVKLRAGILGGDVSILVQVLNDTLARVDQEALQEAGGQGYRTPLKSGTTINPYSNLNDRYGRGGNKR